MHNPLSPNRLYVFAGYGGQFVQTRRASGFRLWHRGCLRTAWKVRKACFLSEDHLDAAESNLLRETARNRRKPSQPRGKSALWRSILKTCSVGAMRLYFNVSG